MNVLIIEDTKDIAASIYDYLESLGYTIDAAGDGVTGLHLAVTNDYDVVILDLGLPGIDGIDLCRRLRQDALRFIPVLMLTARDSLANKLDGFNAGADDYLTKPFDLKELAARVKVLSERISRMPTAKLQVGDLTLDVGTHEVTRAGRPINLNPTLFRLMLYLMQNPHRVIKREEIEYAIWQDDPPDSDALRTHLSYLRQAIDKPFDRPLLHTVRGFGYKLTDRHAEDD
ncbi:MAG TPA: DNA-binding response regulator [Nitrosomonas nitrosa]|jgi:DNA-binding response OmpR family regulator|uniref:Response regulator MprA n=1 Tax=Nitrosomonas nitrosa TaxID=52442 RepID=A0A1I4REW3_9PROT|nr:response regulator transcription factor [Nitrosomonas nitrosa]MCO6434948.1 response regulator transcription factor [Nitrosomonas nitrosa]PTQ92020.1 winged helix family two component transcriptional regulator [Nitrosomonas nitrosa]CAE6499156.1 Response regulator MprA [Nitrosomonas nitrosa]SFM50814.1 two component transcriptional regulator, winged helix family [Nitrosomonas nitrosa]HBZ30211.1 DNA-binding response regulator [Nitrosomonas nitrosa]